MWKKTLVAIVIGVSFTSCIVQSPKYAVVESVLILQPGMTKDSISSILGIPPYDLKTVNDSETIIIYKYRTTDRKTIPFNMKQTNGIKAKGKWVDLFIAYGKDGRATSIRSCSDCEEIKVDEKKGDVKGIVSIISAIALPAILVFLGLK